MSDRAARVGELMKRELGALMREIRDPCVQEATLVTVTHVAVSADLSVARVLVSVIAEDRVAVARAIGRASRFLRGELARRLSMKKTPELRISLDDTEDRAGKVDSILRDLARERKPEPT